MHWNIINKIANTISEDIDVFEKQEKKWAEKSVLSDDSYYKAIGILKDVCKKNGCVLDHTKFAIEFIPSGFVIKNIYIDCPNPKKKKELVDRLALQSGDESIKHTFNDNLRVNLLNAMNKDFGERIREELNLDVTFQFRALPPGSERAERTEMLPMVTITTPKMKGQAEDKIEGFEEPLDNLPGLDLGFEEPEQEQNQELLKPELEEPELPKGPSPEDLITFPSESIKRIADLITD